MKNRQHFQSVGDGCGGRGTVSPVSFRNQPTLISGNDSNLSDTTNTLKWVSDPFGTLCIYDSLTISKCSGCKRVTMASVIAFCMGPVSTSAVAIFAFNING